MKKKNFFIYIFYISFMKRDNYRIKKLQKKMVTLGFEPRPSRTSALNWRLRPLGQMTFTFIEIISYIYYKFENSNEHEIISCTISNIFY